MNYFNKRERFSIYITVSYIAFSAISALYFFFLFINNKYDSIYYKNVIYYYTNPLFWVFIICFFILVFFLIKMKNKKKYKKYYTNEYFRNIPCDNNLVLAYFLLYNCTNFNKEKLKDGIFKAFILKWIHDNRIVFLDNKNSSFSFKKNDEGLFGCEKELYNYLFSACNGDNVLEVRELKKWCSSNNIIKKWYKNLLSEGLQEAKMIKNNDYTKFDNIEYEINLENNTKELIGLKNYLLNFSNFEKKHYIEVMLWDNYLIFAELLGIADKVKKQLGKYKSDYGALYNTMVKITDINFIIPNIIYLYLEVVSVVCITIIIPLLFGIGVISIFTLLGF